MVQRLKREAGVRSKAALVATAIEVSDEQLARMDKAANNGRYLCIINGLARDMRNADIKEEMGVSLRTLEKERAALQTLMDLPKGRASEPMLIAIAKKWYSGKRNLASAEKPADPS